MYFNLHGDIMVYTQRDIEIAVRKRHATRTPANEPDWSFSQYKFTLYIENDCFGKKRLIANLSSYINFMLDRVDIKIHTTRNSQNCF